MACLLANILFYLIGRHTPHFVQDLPHLLRDAACAGVLAVTRLLF